MKYWLFELFYRLFPRKRPYTGPHARCINEEVLNAIWEISDVPLEFKGKRNER